MVKELGPLATLVKEIDGVKKQVEKSIKDSNKVLGNSKTKNDEEKLKEQFKICYDLNTNLAEYHEKVEALEEEKEPSKVKGFDNKKKAEITRIEKWQGQLDAQLKKILPGEKGEEYTKELKGEEEEEEEEDDDEEEEEDEDEEEYEDEEEEEEEGTTQLEETGMSEAKDTLAETAKTEEDEEEYEEEDDDEEEEEEEEEEEDEKKQLISKEEKKDEKEKNKEKDKKVEKEKQNKVEKEKDKKKEKEKEKDKKKEKEKDKKKEKEKDVKVEKEKDKKEKDKKEKDKKGKKKVEEEIEKEEEDEEEDDDEDEYEEDEEDEEEEDDEEEEEEEEDEEEEQKGKDSGRKKKKDDLEVTKVDEKPLFEALYDYSGEEEGDLTITKGEILTIVETRDDGWWMAENEKGEKGVVPKTYLKMYNKYKDVQQEDGEDEDEEEDDEDEEDKEDEEEDEDEEEKPKKKKGGKKLWGSIKKAVGEEDDNVNEEDETSVTDVLHALGAVPSGFRPSTLGPKFDKDEKYTMQNYLTPNLSKSNMFYKDLFYDPAQNKIRASPTKLDRIITLQNFKQIPLPGQGIEVMGRQVRVCLFDGQNILSNVHTIKVASVDKEQRAWSFSNKVSDNMDPFSHAEFFIRGNNTDDSIGILLELCVLYKRTSTEEQGEFSCGWTHIPLVEPTRNIVQNRQFDLHVNGGTPYEKGVEVDPSISRRTTSSAFMSLMSGNKQPRVSVKVAVPKLEQKNLMELLPETIVGNASLLPFYSYHRQILADTLLRDRIDLDSTELIHNPEMCTFPKVADQHDMMKLLRDHWIESSKSLKRVEMRDVEHMKNVFKTVVMETVYPLVHSSNLPKYNTSDRNSLIERQEEINKFKKGRTDKKSTLALLLSADMDFTPFDMSEVAFDVIGPHCLEVNSELTVEKKDTR